MWWTAFFVGQGVGSAALGAVNIAVPFITFVVALTAMFPMGGATIAAIRMGRGDKAGANHAFMTAFSLTLLMSAVLMAVGMVFSRQIVDISDAKDPSTDMLQMAVQYLFYYAAFSIPMALNLIYTAYFFSTKRTGTANAIAVSRGIAIKALMIFCLPLIFRTEAIWLAPFVTEVLTLLAAMVLSRTSTNRHPGCTR